ncbi:ABC transporter permease, partial [Candidatus Bathyarchaeota archaeon]
VSLSRILVKLEEGADLEGVKADIEALDPDILGVDIAEEVIDNTSNNILLAGPRRVEELGVYFAALVSSVGIVLIVSTTLRTRLKELTVMAIRGFSSRQLAMTLLVESLGVTLFSIALGLGVGLVMLHGETRLFNAAITLMLERRVVFPPLAQLTLIVVVALLVVSTIIPILFMVRNVSENPMWRTQE